MRFEAYRSAFGDKRERTVSVVEGLDLAVADREFLAVIGPSGCGKSTILRMIDGLLPPDKGEIRIEGKLVVGPGGSRGMVFQNGDLFPWRTALQNVEFGLQMLGVSRDKRRAIALQHLTLVGLTGFEDAYPYQLSGGMQQRVGIARALAIDPAVLLMDEPFGALDVQTRELLQDELLRIWQMHQKTVLFVTHSIEEAIYLADRIIVLTQRPARIDKEIVVPFARPRTEDVKSDPAFVRIRRDIWDSLKANIRL